MVWLASHALQRLTEDVAQYADVPGEALRNRFTEISALDRAVGKLRHALTELDVRNNTLVWYCSDNGLGHDPKQSFNGPWRKERLDLRRRRSRSRNHRMAQVIQAPRQSDMACVTSDILPTLLDLLSLSSPEPSVPSMASA